MQHTNNKELNWIIICYFFELCLYFIFLCWLCNWLFQLLSQHVKIKNWIELLKASLQNIYFTSVCYRFRGTFLVDLEVCKLLLLLIVFLYSHDLPRLQEWASRLLTLKLVMPAARCAFNACYVLQYPIADAKYCSHGNELNLKLLRIKLANFFFIFTFSYIIISSFLPHSHASSVSQSKKLTTLPFSTDHHSYNAYRSTTISCELEMSAKRK
jgi:hypothetical protein